MGQASIVLNADAASRQAMLLAPEDAQFVAFAGEVPARRLAIDHSVGPEMPEVPAQFAPGREHHNLDVIEQAQRLDDAPRALPVTVFIGEPQFLFLADGAAQQAQIDPPRYLRAPPGDT